MKSVSLKHNAMMFSLESCLIAAINRYTILSGVQDICSYLYILEIQRKISPKHLLMRRVQSK